jgi:hypothetical protein
MIHQAKSNPQLLDEQIFSERLASAISAIAHLRHWGGLSECLFTGGKTGSRR